MTPPHYLTTKLLFLFSIVSSVFVSHICSESNVRGVRKEDLSTYTTLPFTCSTSQSLHSLSLINDNYCDCANCLDEPGTSASTLDPSSPRRHFYCENQGYIPKYIFNSFVNDGICDCCDGSDEYDLNGNGNVKCENTCQQKGNKIRTELKERIHRARLALDLRVDRYVRVAQEKLGGMRRELEQKEEELKLREPELDVLKDQKNLAEKQEEIQRRLLKEQLEKERGGQNVEIEQQKEEATGAEQTAAQADSTPSALSLEDQIHDTGAKVEQIKNSIEESPEIRDFKLDEAEKARAAFAAKEQEVSTLRSRITELKSTLDTDFGPDQAFFILKGQCFKLKDKNYEYELCPFDKSTQKDERGYGSTSLGKWGNYVGDETSADTSSHQKYRSWLMENGQGCWNGPNRSTRVNLHCGVDEKLTKVDEPSRCVYVMDFETPAACETEDLRNLEEELKKVS
uniref:Glucosidase 2 subunit beta n=1 Tax=Percolomonas cosmopolitus TaxID=63605 RepID=A0A7S1KLC1_9EUKA|mmetsp:Transcript_10886/g.40595  ORF Transcript_10886/g.40595 Transcript_10886/m.40595 type:complete len:455 (+) Transcript_10886:31-1395(+)|eukprot:CAMPEP_0117453566 /NCGR_PEP_ID=MMETSP0759-20121206/10295_1 /TAXON_ID=63605 /ORGANISM="Percolomonas cosmopolitus, Strain WS" /LENGTH=454 /DNA_ID=CAMNT_0005246613 /DNA_START=31 /DNA_END=1395 /DNA_ORIENTATION=-